MTLVVTNAVSFDESMYKRIQELNSTLQLVSSCSYDSRYYDADLCQDIVWQQRETAWREHVLSWERERAIEQHRYHGTHYLDEQQSHGKRQSLMHVVMDLFEPEYSCCNEIRVPNHFGDGPKWVCGVDTVQAPCETLSLGSNYDAQFEEGIFQMAGCKSYIIDPTLQDLNRLNNFNAKISKYNAKINTSVGIGQVGTKLKGRPLIPLSKVIEDYGVFHFNFVKADIEGAEFGMMKDVRELCQSGKVKIDHLNLEIHQGDDMHPAKFVELFETAYYCQLMLFHKERNAWGCEGYKCVEFSWISFSQAWRTHKQCETLKA